MSPGQGDSLVDDRDQQEARRFTLPDEEKERRLQEVRARLRVDGQAAPVPRTGGGWLLPALFWTALIGLGTLGASYWLSGSKGDTTFQVVADGSLELRMGRGGHYEVSGAVGAVPIQFLVDTGASVTAIPRQLGERIGIRECPAIGFDLSAGSEPGCCRKQTFHTANGTTEACVGRVPSLRFGPFEVRNASVAVMPGMGEQALLGMNVLKHFNLAQEGRRLTVSPAVGAR